MAEPAASRSRAADAGQSVGDLTALAVKDLTRLIRYELDLAKLELRADARRIGMAAALGAVSVFVACLVLVLLCFALAYGLVAVGIWEWAAFLIVAGLCVVLAGGATLIVISRVRRMSGLRKTRQTVQQDLALLRREPAPPASAPAKAG